MSTTRNTPLSFREKRSPKLFSLRVAAEKRFSFQRFVCVQDPDFSQVSKKVVTSHNATEHTHKYTRQKV